jgi:transposase
MMTATVLSGPERRRRWTMAEKARIVKESFAPEANVAEVARRHDVHPNLLHAWRQLARAGTSAGGPDTGTAPVGSGFSPVVIASDASRTVRRDAGAGGAEIEVMLRNGRRLRVPEDTAPARVAALADVLEGRGR